MIDFNMLKHGFIIIAPFTDIDECGEELVTVGGPVTDFWCDQKCINTIGWFECDCNNGYRLGEDNATCLGNW